MDRARPGTGFGINPLSFQEIDAWARLRRVRLMPWHIDALTAMDAMRLALFFDKTNNKAKQEEDIVSDRPLTPALFGALFPTRKS